MTRTKIKSLDELLPILARHRDEGKRIVFTNGCFDLLHVGHVRCLAEAAGCGQILVVGVNSDASVRRLKGPGRPVVPQGDRAAIIEALESVDYVLVFDAPTPIALIQAIRPDVVVKGGDYRIDDVVGADIVAEYGGEVRLTSKIAGRSSSALLESLGTLLKDLCPPAVRPLTTNHPTHYGS